jgi:hypothetical protein
VGAHGCVGGWMARFGLAIAIGAIINRQTDFRLAPGKLQWNFPAMRRTVRALPVLVNRRVPNTRKSRLRMTRSLSTRPGKVIRTPSPVSR